MAEYFTQDLEHPISIDELRAADRETQLEVMDTWFRQKFEDPAERTPYESAEGGYIWIWGGPYDAREELENEFSRIIADDVIDELVKKLEQECWKWAPTPSREDYEDHLIQDLAEITDYYHHFSGAILDIEKLLEGKVDDSVSGCLWRLLYVNVITALETYLSDAFINTVVNSPKLMRQFIQSTPEFQAEKIPLSTIFEAVEGIQRRAHGYLLDVVWHHLERVKPMYRATLGIEFPSDSGVIFRAILTRHDIVHRNGKTKDGMEIMITSKNITELIEAVEHFVQEIDAQLAKVRIDNQLDTNEPPINGPLTS